jgi:hypothetical protein
MQFAKLHRFAKLRGSLLTLRLIELNSPSVYLEGSTGRKFKHEFFWIVGATSHSHFIILTQSSFEMMLTSQATRAGA